MTTMQGNKQSSAFDSWARAQGLSPCQQAPLPDVIEDERPRRYFPTRVLFIALLVGAVLGACAVPFITTL